MSYKHRFNVVLLLPALAILLTSCCNCADEWRRAEEYYRPIEVQAILVPNITISADFGQDTLVLPNHRPFPESVLGDGGETTPSDVPTLIISVTNGNDYPVMVPFDRDVFPTNNLDFPERVIWYTLGTGDTALHAGWQFINWARIAGEDPEAFRQVDPHQTVSREAPIALLAEYPWPLPSGDYWLVVGMTNQHAWPFGLPTWTGEVCSDTVRFMLVDR